MSEKGSFIRVGTAAEPMPVKMIESFFARRTRNSIGKIKSNRQNLKFEQLKIYYEASDRKLNAHFASNLGLLTENRVFNFVAFLVSDINSVSIKVAKYKGINRVNLIENNEYGYCSIIKATKQVLDKIDLENKTRSRITSKERIDTRLWNAVALREAIINAIVHNDYTREVPPKFEIFDDRIEITSAGSLPDDLSRKEFFQGFSVPRNQELMRIFKDLELVEYLGSGIPRILQVYPEKSFHFTENFLRMTFPNAWSLAEDEVSEQVREQAEEQAREQVEEQVLLVVSQLQVQLSAIELMNALSLKGRRHFIQNYLKPAIEKGFVQMSQPDSPKSPTQKYHLTAKGKALQKQLKIYSKQ